jgi:predicted hydrolase (HD superfamily)
VNEAGQIMVKVVEMTRLQKHTKTFLALGMRWLPRKSGLDEEIVSNNLA